MATALELLRARIPASLIQNESGGRWDAQNNARGAGGERGHFGRIQFGKARLREAEAAGVVPPGTANDPRSFMASPEIQQAAESWHFGDIDKFIQNKGLDKRIGTTLNGVPATADGMRAVAHLGGKGGLEKFMNSEGKYNPPDANGTRLFDYFSRHTGGVLSPASATVPRDPIQNPASPLNTMRMGADETLPFNTGIVPQMVPPRVDPNNFSASTPTISPAGPAGMALPGMLLNTPDPNASRSVMASVPQFTRPQQESTLALGPGGSGGAAAMAPSAGFTPEAPKGLLDNPDITKGLEGIAKGMKPKEEAPMQITPTSNFGNEQTARMGQAQAMMAQLLASKKLRRGLI